MGERYIRGMSHGRAVGGVIAAVVIGALSGCTASGGTLGASGSSGATASPSATDTPVVTSVGAPLSGVGTNPLTPTDDARLAVPEGAHTVALSFSCVGTGTYTVDIPDATPDRQAGLAGACGSTATWTWTVRPTSSPSLSVVVPDGATWTATPTYSSAVLTSDSSLVAVCAEFGAAQSAVMNAIEGYSTAHAFGLEQWKSRLDAAADQFTQLAATAPANDAAELNGYAAAVSAPQRTPDALRQAFFTNHLFPASTGLRDACAANQTPVQLTAEFGG
jgi:hypothetical protein